MHQRVTDAAPPPWTRIRRALLKYYLRHRRDLPWRRSRDPYAIWVSEIMLQQTQVDTVIPRYAAFLLQFPTVVALAAATEDTVCEAWAGLGYYRRARFLHAAARQVVAEHGGVLPNDVASLLRLRGIGKYTAGAVASIAYGVEAPLVDGNVARVLSRLCAMEHAPDSTQGQKLLWAWAAALVRGVAPGDLNQALMELGAMLCTPTAPQCLICPVRGDCAAYQQGTVAAYPRPVAKVVRQDMPMALVYAACPQTGGVWLKKRPLDGLWAGLWELPSAAGVDAKKQLAASLGQRLGRRLVTVQHELTHRRIQAEIFVVLKPRWAAAPHLQLVAEPMEAPLSGLARKAIQAVRTLSA